MKKVLLAGEGRHELGGWADRRPYRDTEPAPGALVALLGQGARAVREVADAVHWREIKKFKAGDHRRAEERNVRGAALRARDAGSDVLAFARDRDGDVEREKAVEAGIAEAEKAGIAVIGGVAVEALEAWVLALEGHPRTQDLTRPKDVAAQGGGTSTAELVARIGAADPHRIPTDARSLRRWLDRARVALGS